MKIKKVTNPITKVEDELHVWHIDQNNPDLDDWDGEGYYACFSGYQDGLYSESDNIGPFDTETEAEENVKIAYHEWHTSE